MLQRLRYVGTFVGFNFSAGEFPQDAHERLFCALGSREIKHGDTRREIQGESNASPFTLYIRVLSGRFVLNAAFDSARALSSAFCRSYFISATTFDGQWKLVVQASKQKSHVLRQLKCECGAETDTPLHVFESN